MQNVDIGMSSWIKNWATKTVNFKLNLVFSVSFEYLLAFDISGRVSSKNIPTFKGCEGEVGIAEDIVVYDRGGTRTSHARYADQIQNQRS